MIERLVSVIVPACNAERFLEEALISAFAQDHPELEVIVVDDGSTDATATIAERFPVRLLRQRNAGPAAARNAGLAAARGTFVTVLDADDIWPADRLSAQLAHLAAHPEHDLVLGLTVAFVTPGEARPPHFPAPDADEPFPAVAGTMLCRRSLFDRIGQWNEGMRQCEDIDWLARAKDAGVLAGAVDRVVLRYRIHAANTSRDRDVSGASMLRVLRASVHRMASPLVSVVVPLHQGEQFIADALAGIAAQTHPAVETIVVDDGSTDAGAEIAAGHDGVCILRQEQRGPAAARNAGIAVAAGEYVAFLDQDDLWHPEKLARQVEVAQGDPEVDLVLCHLDMLLADGQAQPDWFPDEWIATPQPGHVPSAWLVRRTAFARIGMLDERLRIANDADWLARAESAGMRSVMLPDVLACWRVHGANGSYDRDAMQRELFTVLRSNVHRQQEPACD